MKSLGFGIAASPTHEAKDAKVRHRLLPFQQLALATAVLTLALIALGGAVRATDSGLACPDWPFCYGKIIPRQADIPPDSGYTLWNVWLEHSHRMVASVVGVLIAVLGIWALRRYRSHPWVVGSVVVAGLAVVVQATLGALVVLHLLKAELVTAHTTMAMVVIASLLVAAASLAPAATARRATTTHLRVPSVVLATTALIQIVVGSHVTGLKAALAYGTNPLLFNGKVLPRITTEAQAYHASHRLVAYLLTSVAFGVLVVAWREHRLGAASRQQLGIAAAVAGLVLVQVAIGFANLIFMTPPAIVTAHLAVASWIWVAAVVLVLSTFRRLDRQSATTAVESIVSTGREAQLSSQTSS